MSHDHYRCTTPGTPPLKHCYYYYNQIAGIQGFVYDNGEKTSMALDTHTLTFIHNVTRYKYDDAQEVLNEWHKPSEDVLTELIKVMAELKYVQATAMLLEKKHQCYPDSNNTDLDWNLGENLGA